MSYEITGKIIEKYDSAQVTDRFKKREFVIEKHENVGTSDFVENIKFQLTQDRCDLIDNINKGDEVKLSFNIRGRKWEKNGQVSYFTNLEAWKVEKVVPEQAQNETAPPPSMDDIPAEEPTDDLPF